MTMQDVKAGSIERVRRQAGLHADRAEWSDAIACWKEVMRLEGPSAHALLQLSYVSSLAGHYRSARSYVLEAAESAQLTQAAALELLSRLRTFNEIPLLRDSIRRLGPPSSMSISLLLRSAAQLTNANLPDQALSLLNEAWRGDPHYPPTLLARAQVLMYRGCLDAAATDVATALRRAPSLAHGYWLQASLRRQTADENHVDAIRTQLAQPGRSAADVALLGFALHKELDDLGDHRQAWLALELACRAKRSVLGYRAAETDRLFQSLLRAPVRSVAQGAPRDECPTPIFIVGMHRSGTTLLESLLDGSPEISAAGELYDFTSAMRHATDHHCRGVIDEEIVKRAVCVDLADVGNFYMRGLRWRLGTERCFTDKLPSNFLNLGFIATALPNARILHMVRDPLETCFSNLRELFSSANPYSYIQSELAAYYKGYRRLMTHWSEHFSERILDVHYTQLVSEPEAVMREVCSFCGITFHPDMLEAGRRSRSVVTASAVQVRSSITARSTPKWKPYERELEPLIAALSPR